METAGNFIWDFILNFLRLNELCPETQRQMTISRFSGGRKKDKSLFRKCFGPLQRFPFEKVAIFAQNRLQALVNIYSAAIASAAHSEQNNSIETL